jgi:hypothetical protein
MKAISLTQPWATLVALNAKLIETRSWSTAHRGPIAIHAAKRFPRECMELALTEPFRSTLRAGGVRKLLELPVGAVVATAYLDDCVRFTETNSIWSLGAEHERAFGDFTPGRYGFILSRVQLLATPIPCRGALGLWDVPDAIASDLVRRVA